MTTKGKEENGNVPLSQLNTDGSSKQYNTLSEKDSAELVEPKHKIPLELAVKLRIAAIVVSIISVFLTLGLGVSTLVIGILENSSASFGFALTAILDTMSSLVVIWRYYGGASKSLYSPNKERISCIVLGVLFIISACTITIKSADALAFHRAPKKDSELFVIALINGVLISALAVTKFTLGSKLESKALITDAFNSLAGAIIAFGTLVSAVIYDSNKHVWYLDSVVAIVTAMFLLIYGFKLLCDVYSKSENKCVLFRCSSCCSCNSCCPGTNPYQVT